MGLTKQAHGLPRFMMDCGWWRNGRRWRRPTLAEIGLHHAAVSFSNEHGTDGIIPGPAEDLAVALSLPVKDVKRTVPLLIERAVWVTHADGDYEILGFLDHNPSRHEVNRDRQQRVEKAQRANHQRWHVKEGVKDPDCPHCQPDAASAHDSPDESSEESPDESCADSNNGRKERKERLEGTEPPPPRLVSEEPPATPQPEEEEATDIRTQTIQTLIARRLDRRDPSRPIVDLGKLRDGVRKGLERDHAAALHKLVHDYPNADADDLADLLEPPELVNAKRRAEPLESTQAAAKALRDRDRSCAHCHGTGWQDTTGGAVPCNHQADERAEGRPT